MPELPEVETTIRYLKPQMLQQVITAITTSNGGESQLSHPINELQRLLVGKSLSSLNRVGKWMLFEFDEHTKVVGHLRMSGRYSVENSVVDHPHNRFQLHLRNGTVVNYIDQRRFGTWHLVEDFTTHPGLKKLGPDVFAPEFTGDYLHARICNAERPIYSALLDQSVVAGLGNIYANEVLYMAGLHPLTPGRVVSLAQAHKIVRAARDLLSLAIQMKGTTLADNLYQDPQGQAGEFYKLLKVYGKTKTPGIHRIKIAGRSVYFDPTRQPSDSFDT